MSKYEPLWKYIKTKGALLIGFSIDHSFLTYKKELQEFGYKVGKISLNNKNYICAVFTISCYT